MEDDEAFRAAIDAMREEDARVLRHLDDPAVEPMTVEELRSVAERREQFAVAMQEAAAHAKDMNEAVERAVMLSPRTEARDELLQMTWKTPELLDEARRGAEGLARKIREYLAES